MSRSSIPTRDADLNNFAGNFARVITASPTTYGLTIEIAAEFTALQEAFASAYLRQADPMTKGPAAAFAKKEAKAALLASLRPLCKVAGNFPGVTPEQRQALGLPAPDRTPTSIPAPGEAPLLEILSTDGHQSRVRLSSRDSERRSKPEHVTGAQLFLHVGNTIPVGNDAWTYFGSYTKTDFTVNLPSHLAPGTTVWLTAQWYNAKAETGPAARPTSTQVNYGSIKLAA